MYEERIMAGTTKTNKDEHAKNPDFIAPVGVEGTTPDKYIDTGSSGGTPPLPAGTDRTAKR